MIRRPPRSTLTYTLVPDTTLFRSLSGCDLTGITLPQSIGGSLPICGCDLTGITLPQSIGGSLDLRGCDLTGITLPQSIGGSLDLRGCDLTGITLPQSIGGSLDLRGCDLTGITLPQSIGGSLDLRGCDLTGITLPQSIGGWLYLSGCDLTGITHWWTENGEATRRRCIAVSDYALIQTDTGQYIAGCRGPWSKEQALAHWGKPSRTDKRAKAFVAAIEAHHDIAAPSLETEN